MRDTDKDWIKIAQENPYWGVLSLDRFLGANIGAAEKETFFRSGEDLIRHIYAVIGAYFIANFRPSRSLDFGCGVGRTLIPIARRSSQEAIGVDVAPNMLRLTERHLAEANVGNARVVLPDDPALQDSGSFDFINSYIVLQHIPPERGYGIFQDLLRLLSNGGMAAIQLTYAKEQKLAVHEAGTFRHFRRHDGMLIGMGSLEPQLPEGTVRMFDYDLNQIMLLLAEAGIAPVVAIPLDQGGHCGVHLYFRKPA